jgi:Viral BACON domain
MLIYQESTRISVHHNLFLGAQRRNPWVHYSDVAEAPEIQADVRNNLMWDVSGGPGHHGTVVFAGGKANIVNNYYKTRDGSDEAAQKRAISICKGSATAPEDISFCENRLELPPARAYVAGNVSAEGWTDYINAKGTEKGPFPVSPVDTTQACSAAHQVLADAGMKPRDPEEEQYLSAISLPSCVEVRPSLQVNPNRLDFSATMNGPNPSPQTLAISDSDGGGLNWSAATDAPWLSFSFASGTTPANLVVAVNSSGLPQGSHFGTITIDAPGAGNSPLSIPVALTVSSPPANTTPHITSPAPGSVLPGSSVTFKWTANGADVGNWRLCIGSTQGSKDLHDSGILGANRMSRDVRRLPTDGRTIWVQLRFDSAGSWKFVDFQYSAAPQ